MNVDTYLKKHPYFVKTEETSAKTIYHFDENGRGSFISVDRDFDLDEEEPISSNSQRSDFWEDSLEWFRETLHEAIYLYYQQHRVRYAISYKKQPLDSAHWSFSLLQKNGKMFYNHFFALKNTDLSVESIYRTTLLSFSQYLEQYGYELKINKENNEKIFFHITEK